MTIKIKSSTCDKVYPYMKWLLVASVVFKAIHDIWGEIPVKIYDDVEVNNDSNKL